MAEYRIGRGFSEAELERELRRLDDLPRNFDEPVDRLISERGWHQYSSEGEVAREAPGPPAGAGPFRRARLAMATYQFSDPRIVIAHFDPKAPLRARRMLLEMRALRFFRYLGGVVVSEVREKAADDISVFGFRYDTLAGHLERGVEWFLLEKDHTTGSIRFRIEATWQTGEFPNWWSRLGFALLGRRYQERWHRRAHHLLAARARDPDFRPPRPREGKLVHSDSEVVFRRNDARRL